jgi:hypothetical protein
VLGIDRYHGVAEKYHALETARHPLAAGVHRQNNQSENRRRNPLSPPIILRFQFS